MGETSTITIRVDRKLKVKARVKCLREGKTLTELLNEWLRKWVEEDDQ